MSDLLLSLYLAGIVYFLISKTGRQTIKDIHIENKSGVEKVAASIGFVIGVILWPLHVTIGIFRGFQ